MPRLFFGRMAYVFLKAIPVTVFVLPHLKLLTVGDSRIESLICLEPGT